jgi:hypothetical protein
MRDRRGDLAATGTGGAHFGAAGRETTRSPAAISDCSRRCHTWRQSSIAQTRCSSSSRAQRSASRRPGSSAPTCLAARTRPVASSTAASSCVRSGIGTDHDHCSPPPLLFSLNERSVTSSDTPPRGRCHAPIRSRQSPRSGGGRHNFIRSDQPADYDYPGPNRSCQTSPPRTNSPRQ